MARGGYRPGAGRPKMTEAEKAERAAQRAAGTYVPKKRAKRKVKAAPKAKAEKQALPAAPEIPADVATDAATANMSPLDYMLHVMRNGTVEAARRDRMAIAAAPFVHARKEGQAPGKRELAGEAATKAASKFKAGSAPLKLVGGG